MKETPKKDQFYSWIYTHRTLQLSEDTKAYGFNEDPIWEKHKKNRIRESMEGESDSVKKV